MAVLPVDPTDPRHLTPEQRLVMVDLLVELAGERPAGEAALSDRQ